MIRICLSALAAAMVAFVGVPAAAVAAGHSTAAQSVTVTMTKTKYVFSTAKVFAGPVTFVLVNKDKTAHNFSIAGKKSALIKPGKTGRLTVTLRAGKYPYRSTVARQAKLKGVVTVSPVVVKPASGTVAFTGKYAGNATAKISGSTAAISANGTGSGTLIGAGSITGQGSGDTSKQPCIPFGGTGTIKGASGSIVFKVATGASGCGDEGGHLFSLTGKLTVVSATGALANATGTLKLTGTYSHDDGSFNVKVAGTLTK